MKKKNIIIISTISIIGILLIIASLIIISLTSPVDKNSNKEIEVVIKDKMYGRQIANLLEEKGLIKSSNMFILYLKFNKCDSLKASTYTLKKSMSLKEIVKTLCEGNKYNKNALRITFKEGKRITDYAKQISDSFNIKYEDVITKLNDQTYLKSLIDTYWFLTDEILTSGIYYPLEGYLSPDTYEFNKNSTIEDVVKVLLNQTDKNLSKYKDVLTNSSRTIHEYLTLGSMAELEGVTSKDRKMIVGVFNNRLEKNMNLGSDVTTYYALQKSMKNDLTAQDFATINPYNTRAANMRGKLPIGPICSVSKDSIDAAINPITSDNLFFVADKNGKVYYTKTNSEHEQAIKEIKDAGNWIW